MSGCSYCHRTFVKLFATTAVTNCLSVLQPAVSALTVEKGERAVAFSRR